MLQQKRCLAAAKTVSKHPCCNRNGVWYGDLQGLNKQETAEIFGKNQVYNWLRSYAVQPPNGENLEMCLKRVVAQLMAGKHKIDQGVGSTSGIRACALRNFNLEIQDYALWEVIENGNSWVPIPVTAPESGPSTALKMTVPSIAEEKICKKNDVEQKVKRTAANNDDKNLAFLTTSSPSIYAFLSTQPQGSQLVHEDLEELHDDDLEEMDLKWNMTLLSMRERKFYQRTRRNIIIDGSNTVGYDKSKVECFNCHKMGHFARECIAPRSKDNINWNQGSSSRAVKIEDASEKAMCAIDGAEFDWSDMAEEE
ncbi:ribonuclease H-like domain-containing protein, partial [Tanacetum coccineum]